VPDLKEAYEKHQQLPVILMVNEDLFRNVYEEEIPEINKQRGEMHRFIDSFDYEQVVRHEKYEIWVPAESL
jgi:hypothetical protein